MNNLFEQIFDGADSAASIATSAASATAASNSAAAALVSENNAAASAASAATDSMILTSDTATDDAALTIAVSITFKNTKLVTTVAQLGAFSLADGVDGQTKKIVFYTKGAAVTGVITPANLNGGTIITFTNVGDSIELLFLGTKWFAIGTPTAIIS